MRFSMRALLIVWLSFGLASASAAGECPDGAGSEQCASELSEVEEASLLQTQVRQQSEENLYSPYVPGEPGQPWTESESLIVMGKLHRVIEAPVKAYEEWKAIHGPVDCHTGFDDTGSPDAEVCDGQDGRETAAPAGESLPSAAKMVRLGFHDCVRYQDGTGGCDGCLKFYDMFHKYNDLASGNKRNVRRADPVSGTNNGLGLTADILEEIYTNPNFPSKTLKLDPPLKGRGKSRADLWAFAALVSTDYAMMENNNGCVHNEPCNHLFNELNIQCQVSPGRALKFKTGRRDCTEKPTANAAGYVKTEVFELPEGHKYRDYETTKVEDTPNPSGNSSMITDYTKRVFDFSKKETVAIMGAHSLGEMHGINGLFKYTWQWQQTHFLNNNFYRMLVSKPSYFMMCAKNWGPAATHLPFRSAGGPNHAPASTGWFVRPIRKSVSGGPYEWFHYYNRCPLCYKDENGAWVSDEPRGDEAYQSVECCECNEQAPEDVNPKCWTPETKITKDECMLPTDMSMYINFDSDPQTGFPSGCPGMSPPESWNPTNIVDRHLHGNTGSNFPVDFYATEPNCPKNMLSDGPNEKTMSELVEQYADDLNGWAADFYDAWEKMLSTGYGGGDLVDGPDVLGLGRTSCMMKQRKLQCSLN